MEVEPAPEEPAAASTSGAVPAAPARSPAGVQVAQVVVVQSDLPPDLQHDFRVIAARAVRAIPPGKYRDMAQLVKRYFDMVRRARPGSALSAGKFRPGTAGD